MSRPHASSDASSDVPRPPSPGLPTQTHHSSILVPTPALVESVAGGAHYSGSKVDPEGLRRRHSSHDRRMSHGEVKADHKRVMEDLNELYCGRPTREIFDRTWTKDAVFEDPLTKCKGFHEYAPQWYALPKMFSQSETLASRVMSSTSSPNRLVYSQTQEYTYRFFGSKKVVESIILVDLDDDDKIIRLVDQWHGKDLPIRFGAHFLRRMNAKIVPWLVHVPARRP